MYKCAWFPIGRKLIVIVYYGLGWVQIFKFALGWVGLGQSDDVSWLGQVTENGPTDNVHGVYRLQLQETSD